MNSIAGGGTLPTFPALIGRGVPGLIANATSTVALWPGAVASMWGYSDLLVGMRTWVTRLAIPSLIGGLVGAILLIKTPPSRFDAIVPWLVLGRRHRNPHARRARLHGVPQHPPHERSQEPGRPLRKCRGGGDVAFSGLVSWPVAGAMALGATLGGYGGSRLAQRVPQPRVRQAIIVIGFAKPAKPAPRPAPKGTAALGVTIRGSAA